MQELIKEFMAQKRFAVVGAIAFCHKNKLKVVHGTRVMLN